jgi:hypothetical protein
MADNITLITYAGSTVAPMDDALVYEKAIEQNGIIYGAEITLKNTNTLHINAGHGVICGRKFTIVDSDIPVQLTTGVTNLGRVYIHMDLSNTTEPIQIMTEIGASLTSPIRQEDVNINSGVYELDMATFTIDAQTISDVVNVFDTIENTTGNLKELTTENKSTLVAALNEVNNKEVLDTYEEIMANTSPKKFVGAKGVKEGFSNLTNSLGTKINCLNPNMEMFLGSWLMDITANTTTDDGGKLHQAILNATGWSGISLILPIMSCTIPVSITWYGNIIYAHNASGYTFEQLPITYVAFGNK